MNARELALKLDDMTRQSLEGEKSNAIRLFGIRYSHELKEVSLKEVAELSIEQKNSCSTEISKGIILAKYVKEKGNI